MRIRPGSDLPYPCGQYRATGPRVFDPRAELASTRGTGGPWFSARVGTKPLAGLGGARRASGIPWDTLFLTPFFFPI
ncbi:hypothetical protein BHE74_00036641 [Ensete ventricosum]|nr:hypothetical protein BHE74_00036641 [Ensete ventricosum]